MNRIALLFPLLFAATWSSALTIQKIQIVDDGGKGADVSAVNAYTTFSAGDEVTNREQLLDAISVDVQRMRESGQYSFVKAHIEECEGGVALVYSVASKPRLIGIRIQGASDASNKKLEERAELELGEKADEAVFVRGAGKIKEYCRDHWFSNAEVTWETEVDTELNTVFVTYTVDMGDKLAIKNIIIKGNEHFPDAQLRKLLQQKETHWYTFITKSGKYKEELVGIDVFSLQSFYMNEGFIDVFVHDPVLDQSSPSAATMTYVIEEGQQYHIGKVTLQGMNAIPESDLTPMVGLKAGDLASYANIEAASERLRAYYGNHGYIMASINPVRHVDESVGLADVEYVISEGPIGTINKINVTGNERTADKVIRRELVVYPGEQYNRSRVKASENILRNLRFFETVSVSPEDVAGEEGKYDLNVMVKEQQTGQFTTGVGLSSIDSIVGYAEISEGNFSFRQWPPKGDGQKFKIRAQLGTQRSDLQISFVEPWFLDRKLSLGLDLYHKDSSYYSSEYDLRNDGFRITLGQPIKNFLGYPVSSYMRGTWGYTIEQFDIYDVDSTASPYILAEEGSRTKSTLDYTWLYDSRNSTYIATQGNRTSISPYVSGGLLGAQTDLYGISARSSQYVPLLGNWVMNLRGQLQSVAAFGDSSSNAGAYGDGVPLFDRFFLGGANSLRGFDYRDVSPYNSGDPVGGNTSAFITAELTYPIWKRIRGAFFYDCGFVNEDSWDFDPSNFHDDCGIGFRFDMQGLPLQIDYAWPLTYDDDLTGKPRFNFNVGRSF